MGGKNSKPDASKIIDGKAIAAAIRGEIKEEVAEMKAKYGKVPGLAVVIVGSRPDSATYVRMKKKAAAEVGFYSVDKEFPESVGQEELLACIRALNDDPKVHGILAAILTARHPTPSAHHNPHPSLGQLLASSCGCRCVRASVWGSPRAGGAPRVQRHALPVKRAYFLIFGAEDPALRVRDVHAADLRDAQHGLQARPSRSIVIFDFYVDVHRRVISRRSR